MSVIIRLQGLPWSSSAADIRQYFKGLSIPPGGVHIIGGDKGDAFIAFASDEDARQAMMLNSGFIENSQVQLFLSSKSQMQTVIAEARGQSSQPEEQTIQPPVEPTSVQSYMPGYPPPVRSQDPFQQPGSSPFPGVPVSQPNYPPSKPPLLQPPTTKTPEKPATTVPDYTPQSVEHGYGYPRHNDTTGYNRNMEYDRQQWPPKQFNPEVPPPKPNAESDHYEATFGKDHFGRYYPPKNENEMSGPPPFKEFDRRQPYQEGAVRAPGQFPTGSDNDPRGEKPYGRQGDVGGIRDNTLPPEGEPRRRSRFNERGDDINIQAPDDRYGQSMEHTGTSASRYGEGIRPYDHSQDISRQHQPPVDAKSDAHAAPDPYPDPKMHQRSSFDPRFGHDQSQRQFDRPPLDRPLLDRPPVSENRPLLDRPQGQRFEKQPADYPEMETNQGRSFEQPYHRQQTDHDQGSRFRDAPAPTDPNMPRFDRPPPRGRPPYHEQRFGDGQPERHGSNERVAPEDAWGQDSHYGEHRPREERFDDRPKEENERFRGPPRNEIPPSFEPRFQRPGFREPNPEFRPRGAFPPPRGVMDHWGPRPLRPGPPSREMGLPRYGGPPDQDRRHPGSGDKPHEVPMDHDSRLRPPRFGAPGGPPPRHRFGPDGAQRQNVNNSDADMRDQPGRDREGESRRPVSDVDSRSRRDDDRRERDRSFSRDRDRERDRDRDRDRERDRERDRDRDRDSRNRDFDRSDRRSREDRERDRDRRDYSRDSRGRDDFRDSRSRGTDRFGRERREDRDQRIEKSPLSHQKAPDVESRAASYSGKDQTKQVGILGEAPPGMMPFHLQKQGGNEGANSFNKRESYRPSSQGEPAQRDVDSRGVKRPHQEPPKHDNTVVAKNLIENVTYRDIRTFFSGCEIPWDGLKVINDNQGRRIGVAYIKFMNQRSFWEGLNKNGKLMGDNRVEVLKCPIEEFDTAIDSYAPGKTPPDAIKRARMDESATQQRNSPAVKEKYSQYIVQVKGLGINVKGEDMISFFDDCKIAKSGKGSHIEYDMKRRATGVGFVEMETQHDHQKALAHDGKSLNCRIIRVSSATIRDIDQLYERMKEMEKLEGGVQMNGKDKTEGGNKQLDVKQGRIESGGGDTGSSFGHSCIQLQDLPPMVTVKDIGQFFGGIEVAPRGIQIVQDSNGRSLGEAFVEFSSVSECEKALKFDQHPLGNKNVSIKPISKSEMSDYIRQMRPPSRAPQHGPPPAMHGHPPPGMLPPPHGPPPPQGMFYGRRFLVKVQGLPFTISVGEVLNFLRGFNPIPESVRVMVGNDPAGTSAIVGFRSIEDAEAVIRELDNTFYRNMQVHLSPCPS